MLNGMTSTTELRADLTTAMKAKDKTRVRTLRAILTAVMEAEVAGSGGNDVGEAQVNDIFVREAKTRRESLLAYETANREDLAAVERAELAILADYLPAAMDEAEIAELVSATIADLGVADQGMKAMGRVMGVVTPATKGRADGGAVATEVRRQLA